MDVICGCDLCLVVWVVLFGWVHMVLHGVCVFISIACFDVCLGLLGGLLVWMVWCFGGFGGWVLFVWVWYLLGTVIMVV